MRFVLAGIVLFLADYALAAPLSAERIECRRVTDARNDHAQVVHNPVDGSRQIDITSSGGWTLNLHKILEVKFEISRLKFNVVKRACSQKTETATFPTLCHLGAGEVTVYGDKGETEIIPVYFSMLRVSPMTLDDLYDTLDTDGYLARVTFGTKAGQDVTLTTMFRTGECSVH